MARQRACYKVYLSLDMIPFHLDFSKRGPRILYRELVSVL